jgi:hypothetical protein
MLGEMQDLPSKKPKKPRRLIETHLEDHELQQLRILAAELGTRSVRLATVLIRAGFEAENRPYVQQLVREAEARIRG